MYHLRRLTIVAIFFSLLVFLIWLLPRILNPTPPNREERLRDIRWVSTSPYWLDRQACRWLSLCGLHHVRWDPPALPDYTTDDDIDGLRWSDLRKRGHHDQDAAQDAAYGSIGRGPGSVMGPTGCHKSQVPKSAKAIPDYVLKFAPLVHLYSGEAFWPSDIAEHISHMLPYMNGSSLGLPQPLRLENLLALDAQPLPVFLTSYDDVETRPGWLHSRGNVPSPFHRGGHSGQGRGGSHGNREDPQNVLSPRVGGTTWWEVDKEHPLHRISDPRKLPRKKRGRSPLPHRSQGHTPSQAPMYKPDAEGYSKAPAVLVMVDKGSGILDAFWFLFYSYNLGQTVFSIRFGNHVGDWEHCMVRFENGIPRAMFLSEHAGGKAYVWDALEKFRPPTSRASSQPQHQEEEDVRDSYLVERPIVYSAAGSHAMYADSGNHPYVLPFGLLKDVTDRGPLWDLALNTYAYFYDYEADRDGNCSVSLVPARENPEAPTEWFHFAGSWGDELYDLSDERQYRLFGQYHYITGPLGPKFKRLDREKVCQTKRCKILESIDAGNKAAWYS